ncbi:MAG: FAD-binding oxidoreductase [Proteobacteria bacterium]|nr:FAD-binding oxidoreductase [Pseudomonadota bacterium]
MASLPQPDLASPAFLKDLASVVGAQHVLTAPDDVAPFFTDWRRVFPGSGLAAVRPANTEEVSRVVALCAQHGVAIVPQAGNTSLCGGSVPRAAATGRVAEIVLSVARLNRIRSMDPLNDTMTVEAGCILQNLQQAADAQDRLFPLSLAAEGSCQVGGNLSTNAGGVGVLRYGNARDLVLGLEVVLPDGRVWDGLKALRKDNTGYDLKHLFMGAEGTLGIITAAVLKLFPKPSASATAWIAVESPQKAVELLAALRGLMGDRLTAFELISRVCLDSVIKCKPSIPDPLRERHPWYVLCELTDGGTQAALNERAESALMECTERGILIDVALAQSEAQANALWAIRETIPEAQFTNVKHDVSVPVSSIPRMVEEGMADLARAFPGCVGYIFGHIGDGNLHYNIGMGDEAGTREFMQNIKAVNEIVYAVVERLGGSISAEHGVGQLKRIAIKARKPAVEIELMQRVKDALDPQGIMNPGKVL